MQIYSVQAQSIFTLKKEQMIKPILFLILLLNFNGTYAQNVPKNYRENKSFSIQTDVFDLMAKGFSIGGHYTFNYNRFFLATGINELPDFLNPQSNEFLEKRKFFIQAGYLKFFRKTKGLFLGVETIFQQMEISAKTTNEIKENPVVRIAPVLGYEFLLLKSNKLTITPWISERLPLYSKSIEFQSIGQTYKTADFNFVMGLNLGYRF